MVVEQITQGFAQLDLVLGGWGVRVGGRTALWELGEGEQHDQHSQHDQQILVGLQCAGELFGAIRLGLVRSHLRHRRMQVGVLEHEVFAEQDAGDQAKCVHGLCDVQTHGAESFRAHQRGIRVGGGFEEAQADRLHEDGE